MFEYLGLAYRDSDYTAVIAITTRSYCHEMYMKFLGKGVATHENGHENRVIGFSLCMNYPWEMILILTTFENGMTSELWKAHECSGS